MSVCIVTDLFSIPGLGRFPGEGNGNPHQYSCLDNIMDGGAWCRLLSMGLQRVGHKWVTSLLLSLSRSIIAFLQKSKHLLISWLRSLSAVILESLKIKSLSVSIVSPSICHEVMGLDAMILVFWMLSFKPNISLSSFTFIRKFIILYTFLHMQVYRHWNQIQNAIRPVQRCKFMSSSCQNTEGRALKSVLGRE